MAFDLNALRILAVPDMGSSLEVAHPASLGRSEVTPWSNWCPSADPRDFENDGHLQRDVVFGRMTEVILADEYGEEIFRHFTLEHKYDHPQRKSKDVAVTPLRPRTMAGEKHTDGHYTTLPLRKRFPQVFEQFESRLRAAGRPLPLALLDNVPPEVMETAEALGLGSLQEFAQADDSFFAKLGERLEADKHMGRARNVESYRERARAFVAENSETPKRSNSRKAA